MDAYGKHEGDGYNGSGYSLSSGAIPYRSSSVQIWKGGVETGTDNTVNDVKVPLVVTSKAKCVGNNCLTLTGGTSIVDTGKVFDYLGAFTARLWFKTTSTSVSYMVAQRDSAVSASGVTFSVIMLSDGKVGVSIGSPDVSYTTSAYNDGNWHYISITSTGSLASFYIGAEGPISITIGAQESTYSTVIGGRHNGSASTYATYFTGSLFDVCFEFADNGFCYPLSEGWGTFIYDTSGNGNNGTLIGATLATAWGQTQDEVAGNVKKGFSLYRHDTDTVTNQDIFRRYLDSGIPNPAAAPSGYSLVGNFPPSIAIPPFEGSIVETDTVNGDLLARTTLSVDGITFTARDHSFFEAFFNNSNGADGIWLKRHTDGISFIIVDVKDLGWSQGMTPAQVRAMENWAGGTSAAQTDEFGEYVTDENGHVLFFAPYGV